jgi:DNA-binding NarL/FixJ family response regulator
MIRLLIADDHADVRHALVDLFAATDDITVVAVCVDGTEVLGATVDVRPDIALLDLRMPRMDGLEAAGRLREAHPDVKVVMLSASTAPNRVAEARLVGALGFIPKGADPCSLPELVRTVASGGDLWSHSYSE